MRAQVCDPRKFCQLTEALCDVYSAECEPIWAGLDGYAERFVFILFCAVRVWMDAIEGKGREMISGWLSIYERHD